VTANCFVFARHSALSTQPCRLATAYCFIFAQPSALWP